MRDTHGLKRRATTGLAAVAVMAAAIIVSTSVALASKPTPPQLAARTGLSFTDQQLKAGAASLVNQRQISRFFARHCRNETGRQLAACRGVKGHHSSRQLHRSGGNLFEQPYCAWETKRPWPGYAVMATSATALCVAATDGSIAGVPWDYDRRPLVSELRLFDRRYITIYPIDSEWTTGKKTVSDSACSWVNKHIEIKLPLWQKYEISRVLVCGVSMFLHTAIFPPAGTYWGQLLVDYKGRMPNSPHPLVDGHSENYCYFC
jgi:hypothetical protein